MAVRADVIIAWGHGQVPEAAKSAFERPTRFLTLPNPNWKDPLAPFAGASPLRAILAKYAPGVAPYRVATLGFSASCQGVAALLGSKDGGYLDAAIAIDGVHTGLPVTLAAMTPWFNFGKSALINERLLVITHSSIVPPDYASTTQTARFLWDTLTGKSAPFASPAVPALGIGPVTVHVNSPPAKAPYDVQYPVPKWQPSRRADGLVILGADNADPAGYADHIYQAKAVLPAILIKLLAARWNAIDPENPGASCFIG